MYARLEPGATALILSLFLLANASGCILESSIAAGATAEPFIEGGPPARPLACRISGPYRANNLTVYLLHGPEQPVGLQFLPLGDAIERNLATVAETGDVNLLRIINHSDSDLFAHSGQIVKGGRQDRTLAYDLIAGADSAAPVEAFCVESGRWNGRAGESTSRFGQSSALIASHELKAAILDQAGQSTVWNAVAAVQDQLAQAIGQDVTSPQSRSSLQLTLENQALASHMREYTNSFATLVQNHPDSIGYACVINERLMCVEVYFSHTLFRQMWNRLLAANAVEAVALIGADQGEDIRRDSIKSFMDELERGSPGKRKLNERTEITRYRAPAGVLYETTDERSGAWVHRTYLRRG